MQVEHIHYPLDVSKRHSLSPSVVAIGFFDGVHLGHQHVLEKTRHLAKRLNLAPGFMTFDPHPREVLQPGRARPYLLTPLAEKLAQMEKHGMEKAYVVRFDRDFAALSPEAFVNDVLCALNIKGVVVGFNFTFGHKAAGKAEDLMRLGKDRFIVEVAPPMNAEGDRVSSTRLRKLLSNGEVRTASRLLGRPYRIHGIVEHGAGRGKQLGFPTANVQPADPYLIPKAGVYAVKVERAGETYYGALSIGFNPTFEKSRDAVSVEVYLFDFADDVYGETLYIHFLHYLRPERKFDSAEALITQMHKDVEQIKTLIASSAE